MATDQTIKAFKRVINICVAEIGDSCKNDLIFLGKSLGFTDEDIKQNFPILLESQEEIPEEESTEEDLGGLKGENEEETTEESLDDTIQG